MSTTTWRLQDGSAHKVVPQQSCPIVRSWSKGLLVQQAIIACSERVVGDDPDALLCQATVLIEIAKCIQERGRPRVSAARSVSRLRNPDGLAGFIAVSQASVERADLVGAGEPFV